MEKDNFKVHGIYTISNTFGYEIELSKSGDFARTRDTDGNISDWLEIEYIEYSEDGNENVIPLIKLNGYIIPLTMI